MARPVARGLGVLAVVLAALFVPLAIFGGDPEGGVRVVAVLLVVGLGLRVVRRQPSNLVGWLLLAVGVWELVAIDGERYSVLDYRLRDGHLPLGWLVGTIATDSWLVLFTLVPLLIALFPDGHVPRRWRRLGWAYACVGTAAFAGVSANDLVWATTSHHVVVTVGGHFQNDPSPHGVLAGLGTVVIVVAPLFWVAFLARQVGEWRRAGVERRAQSRWLLVGAAVTVVALVGEYVSFSTTTNSVGGPLASVFSVFAYALFACLAVAILKYRLYDIDRLVSRTVSYAIVTGLLVGGYVGMVALTTRVLPFSSPVGVATSTLTAVALFNPLRRRVQRLVDRRFNRERYDADRVVAAFAARMRDAVGVDLVRSSLLEALGGAVGPATIGVWVRPSSG